MSGVRFTPLSGAHNEDPLCYVLEVDDFVILLDCGWDEKFSLPSPYLNELSKWANKITHVLLSHSSLQHVGALPYLIEKLGCKAQVFATLPVVKMGLMFMYDGYQNKREQEDFDLFDLDDIDNAFNISIVKYSQKVTISTPKGDTVIICAYPSGHSLGGTIWKFFREDEEFIYAVDYNLRAEKHLNPCQLHNLGKPTLLITDSYNALNKTESKNIETNFLLKVTSTLAKKGNVLIPCDTAGRVFELLLVLDTLWRKERYLHSYNIVFLSSMSFRSVEFASHQLEWMSESIVKGFDEKRENPFMFKHIKMKHHIRDLEKLNQPLVVLCTSATLETGYARELFVRWASEKKNTILLTDKSQPGTLTRRLMTDQPKKLSLLMKKKVLLVGEELDDFEHKRLMHLEAEKKKKREEEARKKVIQIRDEEEEVSDEDKEDEEVNIVNPKLFLPDNIRYTSQHLMFPCIEKIHEFDDYGEKINVEELASRQATKTEIDFEEEEEEDLVVEEKEEEKEPPSKFVEETIHLDVACAIEFLEYDGRANQKAIRNILEVVNPKKVILVHGTTDATNDLKNYLLEKKVTDTVETPVINKQVDIALDTNFVRIKLVEELLNGLDFIKVGALDLSFLEAKYSVNEDDGTFALVPIEKKGHKSVYIGELKLGIFRELLVKNGIKAEFKKGCLICNDTILVRRDQKGDILIEGALDKDYFAVRDLLYSQYQVL